VCLEGLEEQRMSEPTADRDEPDAGPSPAPDQPVGTPRWVKVLGILVLLLVLLVAVLHLTGNSPGGPGSHLGMAVGHEDLAQSTAQDTAQGTAQPC
jgi:hypothetical protein